MKRTSEWQRQTELLGKADVTIAALGDRIDTAAEDDAASGERGGGEYSEEVPAGPLAEMARVEVRVVPAEAYLARGREMATVGDHSAAMSEYDAGLVAWPGNEFLLNALQYSELIAGKTDPDEGSAFYKQLDAPEDASLLAAELAAPEPPKLIGTGSGAFYVQDLGALDALDGAEAFAGDQLSVSDQLAQELAVASDMLALVPAGEEQDGGSASQRPLPVAAPAGDVSDPCLPTRCSYGLPKCRQTDRKIADLLRVLIQSSSKL